MKMRQMLVSALAFLILTAPFVVTACQIEGDVQPFGGTIAKSYEESEEWWADPVRPHEDAPNVSWIVSPLLSRTERMGDAVGKHHFQDRAYTSPIWYTP